MAKIIYEQQPWCDCVSKSCNKQIYCRPTYNQLYYQQARSTGTDLNRILVSIFVIELQSTALIYLHFSTHVLVHFTSKFFYNNMLAGNRTSSLVSPCESCCRARNYSCSKGLITISLARYNCFFVQGRSRQSRSFRQHGSALRGGTRTYVMRNLPRQFWRQPVGAGHRLPYSQRTVCHEW